MKNWLCFFLVLIVSFTCYSQNIHPFLINDKWKSKIENMVPERPASKPTTKRKVLLFSVFTGFEHWCIPHTNWVLDILGKKSGAYEVVNSNDIKEFHAENLKQYDAILLNNTCSKATHRNLFYDMLQAGTTLADDQRVIVAAQYENNLLNYVYQGGGLGIFHGAITFLNKSSTFSLMVGGSFDYHPEQQNIEVNLYDSDHPLLQPFKGKSFQHYDEPYFFNNAYSEHNFRPLLWIDGSKVFKQRDPIVKKKIYISWIKTFGSGRVFYCSPSHNAQSFENASLLQFMLNGIQYILDDIDCDDSSIGVK
ncbi:MAG TPA: ThuA domain-containing protein [Saprospiraceae bacterium]|nr:ThuA domain-containing protein [Saprospiraceae bacterium]